MEAWESPEAFKHRLQGALVISHTPGVPALMKLSSCGRVLGTLRDWGCFALSMNMNCMLTAGMWCNTTGQKHVLKTNMDKPREGCKHYQPKAAKRKKRNGREHLVKISGTCGGTMRRDCSQIARNMSRYFHYPRAIRVKPGTNICSGILNPVTDADFRAQDFSTQKAR